MIMYPHGEDFQDKSKKPDRYKLRRRGAQTKLNRGTLG